MTQDIVERLRAQLGEIQAETYSIGNPANRYESEAARALSALKYTDELSEKLASDEENRFAFERFIRQATQAEAERDDALAQLAALTDEVMNGSHRKARDLVRDNLPDRARSMLDVLTKAQRVVAARPELTGFGPEISELREAVAKYNGGE